jgi:hypothetical protein
MTEDLIFLAALGLLTFRLMVLVLAALSLMASATLIINLLRKGRGGERFALEESNRSAAHRDSADGVW